MKIPKFWSLPTLKNCDFFRSGGCINITNSNSKFRKTAQSLFVPIKAAQKMLMKFTPGVRLDLRQVEAFAVRWMGSKAHFPYSVSSRVIEGKRSGSRGSRCSTQRSWCRRPELLVFSRRSSDRRGELLLLQIYSTDLSGGRYSRRTPGKQRFW